MIVINNYTLKLRLIKFIFTTTLIISFPLTSCEVKHNNYNSRKPIQVLVEEEVLKESIEGKSYLLHRKKTTQGTLYVKNAILKKVSTRIGSMEKNDACQNDTLVEIFPWGERTTISLGVIKKDSSEYSIKTIFKEIKLANGYKGQSILVLEKDNNWTFCYDLMMPENLPNFIENNKLCFHSKACFNELPILEEEILCLDCFNFQCFLKEENPFIKDKN